MLTKTNQAIAACAIAAASIGIANLAESHVFIGLQEAGVNGGALTTVADDATFASWSGQYGPIFNAQSITATILSGLLDSVALDILGTAPATIDVFVSVTDAPSSHGFLSSFTSNVLPAGWTVDESSWLDPGNAAYALTTQLGTASFAAIGTDIDLSGVDGTGPYSVTGLYHIVSSGHSLDAALSTLHVAPIQDPASLMLLGGGLIFFGVILRRRRPST